MRKTNIKRALLFFCLLFPLSFLGYSQSSPLFLNGKVLEQGDKGKMYGVEGAMVYWLENGKGTYTDSKGEFTLDRVEGNQVIIVNYYGYSPDTIKVGSKAELIISLKGKVLEDVELEGHKNSTGISYLDPMKTENISAEELTKAACCNLSESFETSPSVDVSFTDAVTGTREIQLLGLSGPNTLFTREQIPFMVGLGSVQGLSLVPGPWVSGIQLNKGAGTVANGYESIAGQINFEIQKPEEADRFFLNLYTNQGGRIELNSHLAHVIDSNWSTILLAHGKGNFFQWDKNDDDFMDMPLLKQVSVMNRWKYNGTNGLMSQAGIQGSYLENTGGQIGTETDFPLTKWRLNKKITDISAFFKMGRVFQKKKWQSIGFQATASLFDQQLQSGAAVQKEYNGKQRSLYANLLYQSLIVNSNHKFKVGATYKLDDFDESINQSVYDRTESVAGLWGEYTYSYYDQFSAVAGLRGDYHNLYGFIVTPRLHLRWAPNPKTVFRASGGRGLRSANIISENQGFFASNRQMIIMNPSGNGPFGLNPEVAWNYGLNFTQSFTLDYREGRVSLDVYRTDYQNQIVVDMDVNPQSVYFYNLEGQSRSNALQLQLDYELINRLDMRMAYRLFDVKTDYQSGLLAKPLVSKHRAFLNLGYRTRNKWKFDGTLNWQGPKRIPTTASNPEEFRLEEMSPSFFVLNGQISKEWKEKVELYLGAENILNFRQPNPIISSFDYDSPFFDGSMVWGPVFGRNIYLGFRLKIK